jgi:hypothetical protein
MVYFALDLNTLNIKIGHSKNVKRRLSGLTGRWVLLGECDGGLNVEVYYHELFTDYRSGANKEYFRPVEAIFEEIKKLRR